MMQKFRSLPIRNSTETNSSFLKEVYLHDWWLTKFPTDSNSGERIGVAGPIFAADLKLIGKTKSQDTKVFHSAAISKRLDTATLVAVDGIRIVVSGCINRSRTIQNGFPNEICNHFCVGFPYYWEEIVGQPCEKSTQRYALQSISFDEMRLSSTQGINISDSIQFDDLPVTFLRDFCVPDLYSSESCTFTKDLPGDTPLKNGSVVMKNSKISSHQNKRTASEVIGNDGSRQQKKDKPRQQEKDKARQQKKDKVFERSEGRVTRSMSKAMKFQG